MDKRQAWYQGWPVTKGGGGSGNWGHTGYPGVGGSSKGTGLGAIGAKPDSTAGERRKLSDKKRKKPPEKKKQPPDMSKWTQAQHKKAIDALVKKPLKELRRRQDLTASQRKRGLQQLKKTKDPTDRERLERGLRNLDIMDQHLIAAIDKKAFG